MASFTIKGPLYRARPEQVDRRGPFERTYLAEGDSWMDASAAVQGSLPEFLAQEFNRRGRSVLIINISTSGQTLQRIEDTMSGDFAWWLEQDRYDGILFSAGGNDFIDAARDPAPGAGLLRDIRNAAAPVRGYDCVRQDALNALVQGYLNPNFDVLYQALRNSTKNAATPMFLNAYDTPVARDAPALRGLSGPWLYEAYTKNGIDPSLWPDLTRGLFADIQKTIAGWATGRVGVQGVATGGVLTPAQAGSTGNSGDWVNEIHPNAGGWRKLARVWAQVLV
jgi:hypothetical protein